MTFDKSDEQLIRLTEGKISEDIATDVLTNKKCATVSAKEFANKKIELMQGLPARPMRHIVDLLSIANAMKLKVVIVTGSDNNWVEFILHSLQITQYVDAVVTANDVTMGKPSAEPYRIGLEKIQINPMYAIAVENAPLGIDSAHNAGLYCIGLTSTLSEKELFFADECISSFSELISILN